MNSKSEVKAAENHSSAFTASAISQIDSRHWLCRDLTTGQQELNERRMFSLVNSQQFQKAEKNHWTIIILLFHYVCDCTTLGLSTPSFH